EQEEARERPERPVRQEAEVDRRVVQVAAERAVEVERLAHVLERVARPVERGAEEVDSLGVARARHWPLTRCGRDPGPDEPRGRRPARASPTTPGRSRSTGGARAGPRRARAAPPGTSAPRAPARAGRSAPPCARRGGGRAR